MSRPWRVSAVAPVPSLYGSIGTVNDSGMHVWPRVDGLARTPEQVPDSVRWRARFVVTLSLLGVVGSFGVCLVYAAQGAWTNSMVALLGVVFCVGLMKLWVRYRSAAIVTNTFAAAASALYFAGFLFDHDLSHVAWLAVQPLFALFLGGRRLGVAWLVGQLVLIGSMAFWVDHTQSVGVAVVGMQVPILNLLALMVVVFGIGVVFDASSRSVLEQVHAAKDAAERASEAKTRFLASVSHELRTPLNGLLGMAELMQMNALPPDQRERLGVLLQSGHQLRLLIDDVLDLTSLDSGRMQVEAEPVAPFDVAERVVTQLTAMARGAGLTLTVEKNGPELALKSDERRITQVLNNLVGNALKFTSAGGVRVVVTTHADSDLEGRVRFDVHDTGPGIPLEAQKHIFEPFSRLGRDAGIQGTGLGLAISKTIADQLGGALSLESREGLGSIFTFELTRPRAVRRTRTQAASEPNLPGYGARVLVVDDSPVNLKVAVGLLQKLGCEVTSAAGGTEALRAIEGAPFDVIFMDLHMPDPDGIEATRRLRAAGVTTPIVALTASIVREELDAALAAGMVTTMAKPVRIEHFISTLERFLPRARQRA